MEFNDEGMSDLLHNVAFNLRVIDLISANDKVFLKRFNCVNLFCILFLRKVYFAE